MKSLIQALKRLFCKTDVSCRVCNGRQQVEVLVMGTDTELVECPYCSNKQEYKKFQSWVTSHGS